MPKYKVLISGGGTGGHVFPAIAIANELVMQIPDVKIEFVGAEGRLEMKKVPEAGYPITGLKVSGLKRKLTLENIKVIWQMLSSFVKARKIINRFKPDVAIGVGGYASLPTLMMASFKKVPTVLQEQNSYPGITNKLLAKKANRIYVAYNHMDHFFKQEKIVFTGNPVRQNLIDIDIPKSKALAHFNLDENKKTILIVGGSLGARTLNEAIVNNAETIPNNVQIIWQTGKYFYENAKTFVEDKGYENLKPTLFIDRMDMAYSSADLIISRAGAIAISELCLVKKPVILVPSPNVSEDHQTKNALALVDVDAAVLVRDTEAKDKLIDEAIDLLNDSQKISDLSKNIASLAKPDATKNIVKNIIELLEKK